MEEADATTRETILIIGGASLLSWLLYWYNYSFSIDFLQFTLPACILGPIGGFFGPIYGFNNLSRSLLTLLLSLAATYIYAVVLVVLTDFSRILIAFQNSGRFSEF